MIRKLALLALVLILISPVSAEYKRFYPNGIPTFVMERNHSYTISSTITSSGQQDALCVANGYGSAASAGVSLISGNITFFNASPTPPTAPYLSGGSTADYPTGSKTFTSGYGTTGNQVAIDWYSCYAGGHWGDPNYAGEFDMKIWIIPDVNVTNRNTPNFIGSPVNGSAPLQVTFTLQNQTSINGAISWSFGDGNVTSSTAGNVSHLYQNQGVYSVSILYSDWAGNQNSVTKLNYITVDAPNATKTKYFQTIDGTNGNIVLNSSIQLEDIENASWTNATGLINDGMSSITTLVGHHINAYAQALGYSDSDDLNILNDGQPQCIMMWPTFAKNVSEGNVSLYVTVKDKDTKANIAGAGVTISPSVGSAQSTTTNAAGIAYFVVTNNTAVLVTAQAIGQGYQTATTTINTGTGSGGSAAAAVTILLGKNTVTPTFPTVTTLPGGGTPTPTITILPGCEDQISEEGQAKCRKAQSNQGLSFLSAHMLDLIMICVFVTIMYLLGFKLGK